jgi:hypothetical protein
MGRSIVVALRSRGVHTINLGKFWDLKYQLANARSELIDITASLLQ